jgi:hypothetical protein
MFPADFYDINTLTLGGEGEVPKIDQLAAFCSNWVYFREYLHVKRFPLRY